MTKHIKLFENWLNETSSQELSDFYFSVAADEWIKMKSEMDEFSPTMLNAAKVLKEEVLEFLGEDCVFFDGNEGSPLETKMLTILSRVNLSGMTKLKEAEEGEDESGYIYTFYESRNHTESEPRRMVVITDPGYEGFAIPLRDAMHLM
jgi:hypothetical protein